MAITSKDIAKMAGVSRPAVSATLNGSTASRVSKEKRELILQLAKQYHYHPNKAALNLVKKPSKCIGVILDSFAGIGAVRMMALSRKLFTQGYLMQTTIYESASQAYNVIGEFIGSNVDAIIFPNYILEEVRHENLPIPAVVTDRDIGTDYRHGTMLSTKHLVEHGLTKIATFVDDYRYAGKYKLQGYIEAMADANLPEMIFDLTQNSYIQAIDKSLALGVQGFILTGDNMAYYVIEYLRSKGIRVPEDVAVIGFDGYNNNIITTIQDPIEEFADVLMEILLQKINNNDLSVCEEKILIKPKLCIGNSCGCQYDFPEPREVYLIPK